MWKTVLILLITIVVIPFIAFSYDDPLSAVQRSVLMSLVTIYLVAALLTFIVSTITRNYSQVDKLWSIMPVVYTWYIAVQSGFEGRLVLMALLVTIWGIRLSYNFGRRGGYSIRIWSGKEDYRWPLLKDKPEFRAKWKWVLFNLLFISFYQMGLILLITLPALRSLKGKPLSWGDGLMALLMLLFIVIETVADQQQWNFHRNSHQAADKDAVPESPRHGFNDRGLWALVRHPNYTAEQSVWIVFYLFSAIATGNWINWSVTGAILLVLLFWGSSNFSESITSSKYPGYAAYRKRVPRFIPLKIRSQQK